MYANIIKMRRQSLYFVTSFTLVLRLHSVAYSSRLAFSEFEKLAQILPGQKCIHEYPPGVNSCDNNRCDFNNPNNEFLLACNSDCRDQHGADYGRCLSNGICMCEPPNKLKIKHPMQCLNQTHSELFNIICNDDCRCNHNKLYGTCNYETNACFCQGNNPKPELDCPYENANEQYKVLVKRYKSMGLDVIKLFSTPK